MRPGLEVLEDRQMLSANPLPPGLSPGVVPVDPNFPWDLFVVDNPSQPGITMKNGGILIQGSTGDDTAVVSLVNGKLQVSLTTVSPPYYNSQLGISLPSIPKHYPVQVFDPVVVAGIDFLGDLGNDSFTNSTAVPSKAVGLGSDDFVGGTRNDYLKGGSGPNVIEGGGGSDTFVAGAGDNTFVFAGTDLGAVTITGKANGHHNTLDFSKFGPSGVTVDLGQTATQTVHSYNLHVGNIYKKGIPDLQMTLAEPSVIQEVHGSPFGDYIKAGATACTFEGEGGKDTFVAGAGDNTFVFAGQDLGSVTIKGTANGHTNTLDFSQFGPSGITLNVGKTAKQTVHATNGMPDLQLKLSSSAFINEVLGSPHADVIRANNAGDVIHGDGGSDRLYGGLGVDHLYADDGNALLYAGVQGSPSYFYGGTGKSVICTIGGSGHDTVDAGTGWTSIWADATDTLFYSAVLAETHHIHRVDHYFACSYDGGLTNVGAPSLLRNGVAGAEPADPKQNLADFSSHPLFSSAGPSPDDVIQGWPADCYLMSVLSAVARVNPDRIRQYVADLGDGTYVVNFKDFNHQDVYVRVDGKLPSDGSGHLIAANFGAEGSIWVGIIEKAWTFFRMHDATAINGKVTPSGTYVSISYSPLPGQISVGDAYGLTETEHDVGQYASATAYLNAIHDAWKNFQAVEITGPYYTNNHPWSDTTPQTNAYHHSGAHAYSVVDFKLDGNGNAIAVKIRDPYASNRQSGPNKDGYVWITADTAFYGSPNFNTYGL
jgi:Ca2+-binding RTX toxin-like protein